MRNMTRSGWAWFIGITIVAVAINPALKSIGLLPADVFKSLGNLSFPVCRRSCLDRCSHF